MLAGLTSRCTMRTIVHRLQPAADLVEHAEHHVEVELLAALGGALEQVGHGVAGHVLHHEVGMPA